MPETYSLWLIPQEEVYAKYLDLILKLSEKYNTIAFEPHVTLLGGIRFPKEKILEKMESLSKEIKQFTITLGEVGMTEKYHQNLFIKAEKTPEVKEAYRKAQQYFEIGEQEYMPHLSLLYGNLSIDEKHKIINEIGKSFTDNFIVDKIYLYNTTWKEDNWERVKTFKLSQ